MTRYPLVMCLACVAAGLATQAGCQAIAGIEDTTLADGGNPGEPGFTFAVITPAVALPLDGLATVDVEIRRTGGFEGPVAIAPASAPSGLVTQDLSVPAGQDTAQLVVGAQAPLAIGDTLTFELEATADGVPARTVTVTDAAITGKPGLLDVSFGPDATGYAGLGFGSDDGGAFHALEATPDDRIILVGFGAGGLGGLHFHIARLTGDGRPDMTFNNGGVVNTQFAGTTADVAQAFAVGRQVDGHIVAIGWRERISTEPPDIALVQYTPTGTLGSPVFGNHSPAQSLLNLGGNELVFDGAVLPDSRILAVGESNGRLMIARADPFGSLDMGFGTGGATVLGQASTGLALARDGQDILVAGFATMGGQRDVLLARFTRDGLLDASFGDGGVVVVGDPGANERAVGLALLPDGRIVTGGDTDALGNLDFEVRRFLPDGRPDETFGDGGIGRATITDRPDVAADMALLPDGRIVVIGNVSGGGPGEDTVVARYTRDGQLDPLFDDDGVRELFVGDSGVIHDVEVQSAHKVLIPGGNIGGVPGPGTFGITVRMWM